MRRTPLALALAAALLAGCGGGGAAPVTGTGPEDGETPPTPPAGTPATPGAPAPPSAATIDGIDDAFRPGDVTIAVGGTVTWRMIDEEHDVTWSGAAPAGGNIGRMDRGQSVTRTFTAAGTYAYSCDRHKNRHGGTVTVTGGGAAPGPEPNPPSGTATVTTPGETFSPATVTITAGGTVTWQFTGVSRHNVTFTAAQPSGGNVPDTDVGGSAQRQFPTAGSYPYRCTRHSGMTGEVVVVQP
jgi:plastocyanin